MPVSSGRWLSNSVNASNPPADAPMPTMGGTQPSGMETGLTAVEVFPAGAVRCFGRGESGARGEPATSSGRPLPVFFVTRHPYLSRWIEASSSPGRDRDRATLAPAFARVRQHGDGSQPTE